MSWGITAVCRTLAVQKTRSVHLLSPADKKKWGTPAIPPLDPDYPIPPVRLPQRPVTRPSLSESFRTRMLYSCLVDADYLDTEQFMQGDMPRAPEIRSKRCSPAYRPG